MEGAPPKSSSDRIAAVEPAFQRSKTIRVKLARSLQLQAERVARCQGVSVGFLLTKALEEKIERARRRNSSVETTAGMHLVSREPSGSAE